MNKNLGVLSAILFVFAFACIESKPKPAQAIQQGCVFSGSVPNGFSCATYLANSTPTPGPTATPSSNAQVNPSATAAAIYPNILGVNNTNTWDETTSGIAASEESAGMVETRLGGGANVDVTGWDSLSTCSGSGIYVNPNSTLANTFADIVTPASLEPIMAVNWGSNVPSGGGNQTCSGPGTSTNAANEVAYVKNTIGRTGFNWEIGNEAYGFGTGGSFYSTDYDLHSPAHDASTYASTVSSFKTAILAQDPTAKVGCGIFYGAVDQAGRNWDSYIMQNAPCDFYDFHYYPETPGNENDATLLSGGAEGLTTQLNYLNGEEVTYGKTAIPIYIGEVNSVDATPGLQSTSIVNGLYAAKIIATLATNGIKKATWWESYGNCQTNGNNTGVYGYSNIGGFDMFSIGIPSASYNGCSSPSPSSLSVPAGTMWPPARAFQMASTSGFISSGGYVVSAVANNLSNVYIYATANGAVTRVLIVNASPSATVTFPLYITGKTSGTSIVETSYGKTQYDVGVSNSFPGLQTATTGSWTNNVPVSLGPYTMAVYAVQ